MSISVIDRESCLRTSSLSPSVIHLCNMIHCTLLSLPVLLVLSMRFVVPMSFPSLPDTRIIVNIDKGYTLRRIGIFASSLENQIIHTFISVEDMCVTSSGSDICMYASGSTKSAALELTTVLGNRLKYTNLSNVNKEKVSSFIVDNLDQTLTRHHPDRYLNEAQSMAHFSNTPMISLTNDDTILPLSFSSDDTDPSNSPKQSQKYSRFSPTTLAAFLHQINNQKLGFDFMNDRQMIIFLNAVFKHIDKSFRVSNIRESLEIFHQLIIAQSIFVLRYCSLDQQSSSTKPCLVVSTMFAKPSVNDHDSFFVYQLTALPMVVNEEKYIYSNVPKFIGIHRDERMLITWSDASVMNDCLVSIIVSCAKSPLITSLANNPCLSQLLSDDTKTNDSCQVVKTTDTEPGILEIGNGIWLIYHVRGTHTCEIYSTSDFIVETITINAETMIKIPCDKRAVCFGNQLSSNSCENQSSIILPMSWNHAQKDEVLQIPMTNVKNRLLSTYKAQEIRSYQEIIQDVTNSRSFLQNSINQIGYSFLSIFLFVLSAVILYIVNCLKRNFQSDLDNLKEIVHHTLSH